MGHHEKIWLDKNCLFKFYSIGVMLMTPFVCFALKMTRSCFLSIFTRHPSIRFTMEREVEKKLPFLDIMLDNGHSSLITTVYLKKTFTDLLTNYFSFAPLSYKLG